MSPFQYPPLLPLELRLLVLQPGLPEDPLTGTLLQRKLSPEDDEVPIYEALSYCWGDHYQKFILTAFGIHSGYLDIGPNLASALRALQYRYYVAERSTQIQRMADVAPEHYRHGSYALGPLPLAQDQWLVFEQLSAVDWFRRLWTFQEIVLANQETSIVRLGDDEMLWNRFIEATLFICFNKCAFLLPATKFYDCSDIRDKLYALRGFLEPDTARSIPVDYTKSARQILASACVSHLKQRRNLQFLELCNSTISPSWVVDLQKPLGLLQLFSNASARSAASARLIKTGLLEVAGVPCDEICNSIMDLPPREDYELLEDYITNVLKVFRNLTGNDYFYRDDKCLNELIAMVTFGNLLDHSTLRTESTPSWTTISLEIGRQMIHSCDVDIIVTLLGLSSNLVLHPQPEDGSYKVVGPCYHPGFTDGQALLGDDFRGWEKLWCINTWTLAFWKEGEPLSSSEPRLDGVPLPVGYAERAIEMDEKYIPYWIHKFEYEEYMENERVYDARMSEHRVKDRGVPIQRFRLI
ncbi:hypothetical protein DER44DRAFT_856272 [Fusarium oxysporum]|nr:hypothetical protein DER44DRAFT_856272 [Fusarium oxysporum]